MRYDFTKVPTDRRKRSGSDVNALESDLSLVRQGEAFQLWIFRDDGESCCVLANQSFAYMCILPLPGGDVISFDPAFNGPPEAVEEIYLENGQLDEMPRMHCIDRQMAIRAGLHYFRTGERALFVKWLPDEYPRKTESGSAQNANSAVPPIV